MDVYEMADSIAGSLDGVLDDELGVKTSAGVVGGSSTEAMVHVTAYDYETETEQKFVVLVRSLDEDEEDE